LDFHHAKNTVSSSFTREPSPTIDGLRAWKGIKMNLRHSIMVGILGRSCDRFHEYQPARDLHERLEMAKQIRGADGIEIIYPSEFSSMNETIAMIKDSGVKLSAVNLDVKQDKKWQAGSFTSTDPQLRSAAVQEMNVAFDLAAELGTSMVSCCPLIDGHNYSFEVDYLKQWRWLEECIATGASHRSDIRLSLEYKLCESRNHCILSDMGRTLRLCERIGLPNVGVTLDVGHALLAKETPAEVMCMAGQADRLFYIHFNDNGREWDWDMLPGAINFWDLLEVLFYLDRLNWEGWLSYDISVRNGDPMESMEAAIAIVETAIGLLDRIGRENLQGFIEEGIPARAFQQLLRAML
jgi:xylose isomerase